MASSRRKKCGSLSLENHAMLDRMQVLRLSNATYTYALHICNRQSSRKEKKYWNSAICRPIHVCKFKLWMKFGVFFVCALRESSQFRATKAALFFPLVVFVVKYDSLSPSRGKRQRELRTQRQHIAPLTGAVSAVWTKYTHRTRLCGTNKHVTSGKSN